MSNLICPPHIYHTFFEKCTKALNFVTLLKQPLSKRCMMIFKIFLERACSIVLQRLWKLDSKGCSCWSIAQHKQIPFLPRLVRLNRCACVNGLQSLYSASIHQCIVSSQRLHCHSTAVVPDAGLKGWYR